MFHENAFPVLLFILIIIAALALVITKYDVTHPFPILAFVMSFSVFLAMAGIPVRGFYMSPQAALLIITAVLAFGVGSTGTDVLSGEGHFQDSKEKYFVAGCYIEKKWLYIFAVLLLLFAFLQFREMQAIAMKLGNATGKFSGIKGGLHIFKVIRNGIEAGQVSFSRWNSYENILATALAYSSMFVLLCNLLNSGNTKRLYARLKENRAYLLVIAAYFPIMLLSTGREKLLDLFLFTLVSGSVIYQRHMRFSSQSRMHIIKGFIGCGMAFFVLFLLFGFATGKVSLEGRSPLTILIHYAGSSMPAFSHFIEYHAFVETPYIGQTTLMGIYRNLSSLGWSLPKPPYFLGFMTFHQEYTTNVYTMMRRYIVDYGYTGMHLIMVIMGVFYAAFYHYVRFRTNEVWLQIFYASLMMPLFFSMNDDRFLSVVLSTRTIYQCVVIYAVCKFFIKENEYNRE